MTGSEIRAIRHKLGLTLVEMAAKLEVSYGTISAWERSKARPSKRGIKALLRQERKLGRKVDHVHK